VWKRHRPERFSDAEADNVESRPVVIAVQQSLG
jgi:hypothetical protein